MNTKWTCPNCETVNNNSSECIVCKMTYSEALKKYNLVTTPLSVHSTTNHTLQKNPDSSDIKLNFPEENSDEKIVESKHDSSTLAGITAGISIILGAVGLILCMAFNLILTILLSIVSISSGIFSIKEKGGVKAVIGITIGVVAFMIAFIMSIYII